MTYLARILSRIVRKFALPIAIGAAVSFAGAVSASTITVMQGSDTLSSSRAVINTNFANLNTDKLEAGSYAATLSVGAMTVGTLTSTTTGANGFAGRIGAASSTPSANHALGVGGHAYIGGNLTATGTLTVSGASTLAAVSGTTITASSQLGAATSSPSANHQLAVGGHAYIGGNLTATGTASITGALTLGTALTVANGGTGTTTMRDTGLLFYNTSLGTVSQAPNTVGNSLNYDYTNGRLGVGTSTPGYTLGVHGTASFGGTVSNRRKLDIDTNGLSTFYASNNSLVDFFTIQNGSITAAGQGVCQQYNFASSTGGTAGIYSASAQICGITEGDYADAAGSIAGINFYTSGSVGTISERVRITSAGNVGIGTTTPATKLNVAETTGGILTLSRSDTSITADDSLGKLNFHGNDASMTTQNVFANIEAISAATVTTDAAAGDLLFRTTGTDAGGSPIERMRIDYQGFLGVGTTTLGAQISASTTNAIGLMVDQRGTNDILRLLDAGTNVFTVKDGGNVGVATSAPAGLLTVEQGTETHSLYVGNNGSSTASLSVLGVNGNGFVGIKDDTPSAPLEIHDSSAFLYQTSSTTAGTPFDNGGLSILRLQNDDTTTSSMTGILLITGNATSGRWGITGVRTGTNIADLAFTARTGSNAYSERFRITSGGSVGVASSSPWRTLGVDGTVSFNGLTLNTGAATAALCLSSTNEVTRNTDSETCVASSERYKEAITEMSDFSDLLELEPVSFRYKENPEALHYGFIAEQAERVNPLLVSYDDEGLPNGIRWTHITTELVAGYKDHEARIIALERAAGTKTRPGETAQWILIALLAAAVVSLLLQRRNENGNTR